MKGLVLGKYLPFHKGHQAKIDFALGHCDLLYVVVCASNLEKIDGTTRANWIRQTYHGQPKIEVVVLEYQEAELPNTSVSSKSVSKIWAEKFLSILPPVDLVVTSERYGDFLAEFMGIRHILFDEKRLLQPISATKIRQSPYLHWSFLPEAVKPYYQQKIVFLGTESTGKSSISKALSKVFNASLVTEAGRDLIPDSTDFSIHDLGKVATVHAARIKAACQELKPVVFIDTDIHITQSYAKFQFGAYLDVAPSLYAINKADLYIYFDKQLTFDQDGTRMEEAARNKLDACHRKTLTHFGVDFVEISGNWEERYAQALSVLADILE